MRKRNSLSEEWEGTSGEKGDLCLDRPSVKQKREATLRKTSPNASVPRPVEAVGLQAFGSVFSTSLFEGLVACESRFGPAFTLGGSLRLAGSDPLSRPRKVRTRWLLMILWEALLSLPKTLPQCFLLFEMHHRLGKMRLS